MGFKMGDRYLLTSLQAAHRRPETMRMGQKSRVVVRVSGSHVARPILAPRVRQQQHVIYRQLICHTATGKILGFSSTGSQTCPD